MWDDVYDLQEDSIDKTKDVSQVDGLNVSPEEYMKGLKLECEKAEDPDEDGFKVYNTKYTCLYVDNLCG